MIKEINKIKKISMKKEINMISIKIEVKNYLRIQKLKIANKMRFLINNKN